MLHTRRAGWRIMGRANRFPIAYRHGAWEGWSVKRILVVDDDPVVRELLTQVLHKQYTVAVAYIVAGALDSMRNECPTPSSWT
jgi:PleD family two-component response regulator